MSKLTARFEQNRGHYMIVERDPPFAREEMNDVQLQMMKRCEIPGLLQLETIEQDGNLSLRYGLGGNRMLSEALRTSRWTMEELMGALCALGETLESCRHYMLDADRIRLLDEYMFVGESWSDLKFIYLPIDMPTLFRADDMERLIIRWVMRVEEPDGRAMQSLLRLVCSPGFVPIALCRYARDYLAGGGGGNAADLSSFRFDERKGELPYKEIRTEEGSDNRKGNSALADGKSRSWDLLQPDSDALHPESELWGNHGDSPWGHHAEVSDGNALAELGDRGPATRIDLGRWQTLIGCSAAVFIACLWRFAYGGGSDARLIVCAGLTLAVIAVVAYLWNGARSASSASSESRGGRTKDDDPYARSKNEMDSRQGFYEEEADERPIFGDSAFDSRFPSFRDERERGSPAESARLMANDDPARRQDRERSEPPATTWLPGRESRTMLLQDERPTDPGETYCLIWQSSETVRRVPLGGASVVIGRSAEAAQHVDETKGVSRAHVELVREENTWKAKDLGSRNGSKLNDKPMAPYEWYPLREGDRLNLAGSEYRFERSG
ncbi:DUF6382 domain-containing protein [Cohnella suwonensis]|uniref:DUF6382 domain-containing protein n=1 Tax=Cohnella suwonensis TaxID=696072 RepID=A0ABW0LWU5_9BACL